MNETIALSSKAIREAFGLFPSGIAAISAIREGKPQVIVASSFSVGVSLVPPLAAFYVQKTSSTWDELRQSPRLGVSILGVEHADICRQLADRNKEARFMNVQTKTTTQGAVHLVGAPVWFDCSIFAVHPAGDHDAVQLLIHDLHFEKRAAPLIFHKSQFTQLITESAFS
ncbi:oxidoreductase [Alcaligenes faecalis]|uniref:flavin reductase family protein n=1 Tax=Alcaligenes faecalis TaxID=511 RepID=UPI000A2DF011|nr:flavin reductase family protein [Alcaligenes faecalis]OSZ45874.1 oxidoreductase [Alcaligenes faecalis]OSZ52802.1 oxidoreductase [Alcaligenes faecalis]OSZ54835.1 oxidoreductase [Alcaligenes faecalis]